MRHKLPSMSCLLFLSGLLGSMNSAAFADETPLRVMSFNIRYGTANDGENDWNHRKDFVVETIKAFEPDLLGTQETLNFQRDFLAKHLTDYASFGAGRDDGGETGEMMAIFFRKDRFQKLAGGHFWYSETPDVPGTKAWDSSLPRMASWLKLKDSKSGKTIYFFNTHFDHRGELARRESATLLRQKAKEIAGQSPVLITGDFNAPVDSEVYNRLFADTRNAMPLFDTFSIAHPDKRRNFGTAGGFTLAERGERRIDWIACSSHFKVVSAEIDKTNRNGRTPSDHDPVNAIVTISNQ